VYPTSSATVQETLVPPSTDLPVAPSVSVLAVPHTAVIISAVPSKSVPLIFLAVASLVVVDELPNKVAVILLAEKLPLESLITRVLLEVEEEESLRKVFYPNYSTHQNTEL